MSAGATSTASGSMVASPLHPHVGRHLGRARCGRQPGPSGKDVDVRLQILLGRPDVEPVCVTAEAVQQPGPRKQARERLALDRDVETRRDPVEERRLENVRTRVDPVARGLARRWLLDERDHTAVGGRRHDTERARVVDLRQRDRGFRALLDVEANHVAEVQLGEHVAVADDDSLVDPLGREPDRARGAERLVLDRVADPHVAEHVVAGRAAREQGVERIRQIAHREHDVVHAVRRQPLELAREVRLVRDRQQRLRRGEREWPEPRALPTDEDDGLHGFLVVGVVAAALVVGVVAVAGAVEPLVMG